MKLQIVHVPGAKTKWVTVRPDNTHTGPLSRHHQYRIAKSSLPTGPRGRNLRPGDIIETDIDPYQLANARRQGRYTDVPAVLVSAVSD